MNLRFRSKRFLKGNSLIGATQSQLGKRWPCNVLSKNHWRSPIEIMTQLTGQHDIRLIVEPTIARRAGVPPENSAHRLQNVIDVRFSKPRPARKSNSNATRAVRPQLSPITPRTQTVPIKQPCANSGDEGHRAPALRRHRPLKLRRAAPVRSHKATDAFALRCSTRRTRGAPAEGATRLTG